MLRAFLAAVLSITIAASHLFAQTPIAPPPFTDPVPDAAKEKPLNLPPPPPRFLPKTVGAHPWTLKSAKDAWERSPNDPYLFYVMVQLSRYGTTQERTEVAKLLEPFAQRRRVQRVDLFSLFSGAHAVQETLQLDALLDDVGLGALLKEEEEGGLLDKLKDDLNFFVPEPAPVPPAPVWNQAPPAVSAPTLRSASPGNAELIQQSAATPRPSQQTPQVLPPPAFPGDAAAPGAPKTPTKIPQIGAPIELKPNPFAGPQVKSHPWKEMLKDKKPAISKLARLVPDDFYYVEFRTLNKLLDVLDEGVDWSRFAFTQGQLDSTDTRLPERFKRQLLLEPTPALRPLYDTAIGRVAVAGSDLFLREGNDMTVLFELKVPAAFQLHVEKSFSQAKQEVAGAKEDAGKHGDVAYRSLVSPDGFVRAYAADPRPDLHIRSNSLPALKRILDTIAGVAGTRNLGDSDEFKVIRTIFPDAAAEEDGFVYLSDPFIRHLVGHEVKLIERRRMIGFNHLRMIAYASQMYLTQFGVKPATLNDLQMTGCLPVGFGRGKFASPFGGTYSLAGDGMTGHCTVLNRTSFLTPGRELPLQDITDAEIKAYEDFVKNYNEYWRTYFDPIAVRLSIAPTQLRAETLILPLIDKSVYTMLTDFVGGTTERLDRLPVPDKNLLSLNFKWNRPKVVEMLHEQMTPITVPIALEIASIVAAPTNAASLGIKPLYQAEWVDAKKAAAEGKGDQVTVTETNYKSVARTVMLPDGTQKVVMTEVPYQVTRVVRRETIETPIAKEVVETKDAAEKPVKAKRMVPYTVSETVNVPEPDGTFAGKTKVVQRTAYKEVDSYELPIVSDKSVEKKATSESPERAKLRPDETINVHGERVRTTTKKVPVVIQKSVPYSETQPDGTVVTKTKLVQEVQYVDQNVSQVVTDEDVAAEPGKKTLKIWFDPEKKATKKKLSDSLDHDFDWDDLLMVHRGIRCLTHGLGNQIGLHLYDHRIMFDINTERGLGDLFAGPNANAGRLAMLATIGYGGFLGGIITPLYISSTVTEPKAVDDFLEDIDRLIARYNHKLHMEESGIAAGLDFHHLETAKGHATRAYGLKLGPIRFRMYLARIGDGLFLTNQADVIDDLHAALDRQRKEKSPDLGPDAHAMFRIRPKNWNAALPGFKLAWAEGNREACCKNMQALSHVARAHGQLLKGTQQEQAQALIDITRKAHGVDCLCPDGGAYLIDPDGSTIRCTVHGSVAAPRQKETPAPESPIATLMRQFQDLQASFTVLPEGLRAVVVIERKR